MSHAIITGHSRGVGAALAGQLLQQGFTVLGLSRQRNPSLAALADGRLIESRLDLADTAHLMDWLATGNLQKFLVNATRACLINNAGLLQPVGPLGTQDPAAIDRSIAVNVTAPMLLANAFAAAVPAGIDSRVLHISSGVGRRPCAGWSVYSATKAALDMHARSAALDVTPGLRVASIAPGVIDTDMQTEIRASDPAKFPPLSQFLALKNDQLLSTPEACAKKLARYLLSDDFTSGAVVDVRDMTDA